jgi:hypothetical protein
MDVSSILSKLRSEREDIEQAILFLERSDQLNTRAQQETEHSVIEIRRVRNEGGGDASPCKRDPA